jgi:hypothetical protein
LKENSLYSFLLKRTAKKVFAVIFDHFGAFEKPLAKQLYNRSLYKSRQDNEEGACFVRQDSSSKSYIKEKYIKCRKMDS